MSATVEFPKIVDKETINELPLARYEGPVEIVTTTRQLAAAVKDLSRERLLGFDTESRPAFRRGESYPPSLLQLAGSRGVYLVQIGHLPNLDELVPLVTDPAVLKVGVAIRDDVRKLQAITPFDPAGFIEIANMTRRIEIANTGLRSLCAIFLQFRISKNAQVSNWARHHLTPAQVAYAATDSWVSRLLYLKLEELGLAEDVEPLAF